MQRAQQYRGFDDAFLADFARQQQHLADDLQRKAAQAQRCAQAARREIKRRKAEGGNRGQISSPDCQ